MKVSVLLPVYNTKIEYLHDCFNSIFMQTHKNYEVIVIDNGSTNTDTLEYLNKIKKDNVKIYRIERQVNKNNLSIALNYGLTKCENEFVARMDADDIMLSTRLESQVNYMKNNAKIDILGGQYVNIEDANISKLPEFLSKEVIDKRAFFISHPTVMFRKSKILEIGGYLEESSLCNDSGYFPEDLELWLRAYKSGLILRNCRSVVLLYRRSNDEKLSKTILESDKFSNFYRDKYCFKIIPKNNFQKIPVTFNVRKK